jgi:hypothetical protein
LFPVQIGVQLNYDHRLYREYLNHQGNNSLVINDEGHVALAINVWQTWLQDLCQEPEVHLDRTYNEPYRAQVLKNAAAGRRNDALHDVLEAGEPGNGFNHWCAVVKVSPMVMLQSIRRHLAKLGTEWGRMAVYRIEAKLLKGRNEIVCR